MITCSSNRTPATQRHGSPCCLVNGDRKPSATLAIVVPCLLLIGDAEAITIERLVQHGGLQIGIVALLVLQTVLIVVLMVQNHRQRRAQDEARRQQSEVTHAARLVLVGEMTASIAHEVSQPLSAILSNADAAEMLLCAETPPLGEIRQILEDIRRDDLRANEIVRNLRRLLSKRELRLESIDLNEIVRTSLTLAGTDATRRGIVLRTSLDSSLPRACGDPVHLQQVMLNLIINAMDAMMDVPVDERELEIATRLHDGKSVEVAVIDTGGGVSTDMVPKLFDSFYSTKRDGMGLGLSIARAIVQTHGGTIWVENRSHRGAVFKFTVPVAA
ncbi:MAG TPA: ATP-binding protein [Povalibacter sp.]|nr:ATP-binding protein [Povalibacter sp.]